MLDFIKTKEFVCYDHASYQTMPLLAFCETGKLATSMMVWYDIYSQKKIFDASFFMRCVSWDLITTSSYCAQLLTGSDNPQIRLIAACFKMVVSFIYLENRAIFQRSILEIGVCVTLLTCNGYRDLFVSLFSFLSLATFGSQWYQSHYATYKKIENKHPTLRYLFEGCSYGFLCRQKIC